MSKVKIIFILIIAAILADFAVENASFTPTLKLLKLELGRLPLFVLPYAGLVLGLLVGWLGHVLRVKKQKKAALLAAKPGAPEAPPQ